MKFYEAPDVIEIGLAEEVVLGQKEAGDDGAGDPTHSPLATCLDIDE